MSEVWWGKVVKSITDKLLGDWKIILKWNFDKEVVEIRNGFNWFRLGDNGGFL
jgi:hypothetical protein